MGLVATPVICLMSSLVGLQGPWAVEAASLLPSLMTSDGTEEVGIWVAVSHPDHIGFPIEEKTGLCM